jgi:hypothetical protein
MTSDKANTPIQDWMNFGFALMKLLLPVWNDFRMTGNGSALTGWQQR